MFVIAVAIAVNLPYSSGVYADSPDAAAVFDAVRDQMKTVQSIEAEFAVEVSSEAGTARYEIQFLKMPNRLFATMHHVHSAGGGRSTIADDGVQILKCYEPDDPLLRPTGEIELRSAHHRLTLAVERDPLAAAGFGLLY